MQRTIKNSKLINGEGRTRNFNIDYPSVCPHCNMSCVPDCLDSHYISENGIVNKIFCTFFCNNCERTFIGNYYCSGSSVYLSSIQPRERIDKREFPEHIEEVSNDFCTIYNQAYASQQYGLNEISGMGYRKALEFLVKDYAIFLEPESKEEIKKLALSQCISNHIDNKRIKDLALASAWIGNDETHYQRKQQEYNIDDLVEFINATVSFINSDISAINAAEMIKNNKK